MDTHIYYVRTGRRADGNVEENSYIPMAASLVSQAITRPREREGGDVRNVILKFVINVPITLKLRIRNSVLYIYICMYRRASTHPNREFGGERLGMRREECFS